MAQQRPLRKTFGSEDMEKLKKKVDRITSPAPNLPSLIDQKLQQKREHSQENQIRKEKSPVFVPYGSKEVSLKRIQPSISNEAFRTKSLPKEEYKSRSPEPNRSLNLPDKPFELQCC